MNSIPKSPPARDDAYKAWISSKPCLIPGCIRRTEVAHVGTTGKGTGQKCSDYEAVPLCYYHHHEQHCRGVKWFQRRYRVDFEKEIVRLNALYKIYCADDNE